MKKIIVMLGFLAVLSVAGSASAATDTSAIQVLASVTGVCRITTAATNVNFGVYDPTNPAANDTGTTQFKYRCVKNTTFWAYITRTNLMAGSGVETLAYQLYSDAGRTTAWPTAKAGGGTSAASNAEVTADVYGRIAALQDVAADNYAENVTVTIEY